MARKRVKGFSIQVIDGTVKVEITTENKQPYRYDIRTDDRHPDAIAIAEHLETGLQEAKDTFQKIDVSYFPERLYVTIKTPISYHSDRYTAHKK